MALAVSHRHSVLRDLGLLLARILPGVILAAHGWQKIDQMGIAGVTDMFRGLGIPSPEIAAPFIAWLELAGGILLILGALTPLVALLLAADMLVAALLVHAPHGLFIDAGGWELVGALGAGCLALAAAGAGRISIDGALLGRRTGRRARSGAAADGSTAAR